MKTIRYTPPAGITITDACIEAVILAVKHGATVECEFNEIELTADPSSNPDLLVAEYQAKSAKRQQVWEASPEGVSAKVKREADAQKKQALINASESLLPVLIGRGNLAATMAGLLIYLDACDHIDTTARPKTVIDALERAGFKKNAQINLPKDAYLDRQVYAEYIIGQILDMGIPCHPVAVSFIDRWFDKFGRQ